MKVPSFLTPWFLYIFSLSCFFITNYQRLPNDITNAFFCYFFAIFSAKFPRDFSKIFQNFLIFLVEFFSFLFFSLLFFYKFSLAHAIAPLFPLLLHKYNAFLFCLSWLVFICSNFVQIPYLFSLLDFLFCYFFCHCLANFFSLSVVFLPFFRFFYIFVRFLTNFVFFIFIIRFRWLIIFMQNLHLQK